MDNIVVNYPREPLSDAARRAATLAQRWGLDGSRLAEWAARNANGQDLSPGGTQAHTPPRRLEEGGPTLDINARALPDGRAYLSVTVSWYDESEEPGVA